MIYLVPNFVFQSWCDDVIIPLWLFVLGMSFFLSFSSKMVHHHRTVFLHFIPFNVSSLAQTCRLRVDPHYIMAKFYGSHIMTHALGVYVSTSRFFSWHNIPLFVSWVYTLTKPTRSSLFWNQNSIQFFFRNSGQCLTLTRSEKC